MDQVYNGSNTTRSLFFAEGFHVGVLLAVVLHADEDEKRIDVACCLVNETGTVW